jgi:hypothetical protein
VRKPYILITISALALKCLSLIPLIIDVDEAWFSAAGAAIQHPQDYFIRAVDNKPPGTVWFYWALQRLMHGEASPRFVRLGYIICVVATAIVLSRFLNKKKRSVTILTYLLASVIASPLMLSTTTEGLVVLFTSVSLLLAWQNKKGVYPVIACLLFGMSLVLKQTAVFFIIPIIIAYRFAPDAILLLGLGAMLPIIATLSALGATEFF